MKFKNIKLELFHLRKAFLKYHQGWRYIYNKYFLAKQILKLNKILEKPETRLDLSIHTMLGHQHLIMALWSLASFYSVANLIGKLYLHSDGSLTWKDKKILKKFFPSAEIINPFEVFKKYSAKYDKYPQIKKFRIKYAHNFFLTKFVDPYIITDKKYLLFFDIDILWFKNSILIQQEIESNCEHSWMMKGTFSGDVSQPRTLQQGNREDLVLQQKPQHTAKVRGKFNTVFFKDGSKLPEKYSQFNGGIMLFRKDNLPAEKLISYFNKIDMMRPESQHWVEQAGYAYNLENLKSLPETEYIIKGPAAPEITVKHYTGPRRVEFYVEGIPLIKNRILRDKKE